MPGWWNGIHGGLKILCPHGRAGSNPAPGTKEQKFVNFNAAAILPSSLLP